MLWLAPAGLRGGLKLEAYHQSRQPAILLSLWPSVFWDFGSLFRPLRPAYRFRTSWWILLGVYSGTSDRCSGRFGFISYALLWQPYLRPHHCGDIGFVSRHKPAVHRIPDVLAAPDVVASCITSCRGRRVSFSTDVAASQYVCSRGADNLTLRRLLASRTGFCRLSRQLLARGCSSCSTSTSFPLASLTVVCPTFSFPEDALYLSFLLLRPVVVCPGCTSTKSPRTLPFVGSVPFFSAPTVLTVATATERPAPRGGCYRHVFSRCVVRVLAFRIHTARSTRVGSLLARGCASVLLRDWETARRNSPTDLKHTQLPAAQESDAHHASGLTT